MWNMFKVTIKTPERRHPCQSTISIKLLNLIEIALRHGWHRSGVFIVNFEHIPHLVVVFLLLTLNM